MRMGMMRGMMRRDEEEGNDVCHLQFTHVKLEHLITFAKLLTADVNEIKMPPARPAIGCIQDACRFVCPRPTTRDLTLLDSLAHTEGNGSRGSCWHRCLPSQPHWRCLAQASPAGQIGVGWRCQMGMYAGWHQMGVGYVSHSRGVGIGLVSDGCQMSARWVSDGCQMGVGWMSEASPVSRPNCWIAQCCPW